MIQTGNETILPLLEFVKPHNVALPEKLGALDWKRSSVPTIHLCWSLFNVCVCNQVLHFVLQNIKLSQFQHSQHSSCTFWRNQALNLNFIFVIYRNFQEHREDSGKNIIQNSPLKFCHTKKTYLCGLGGKERDTTISTSLQERCPSGLKLKSRTSSVAIKKAQKCLLNQSRICAAII